MNVRKAALLSYGEKYTTLVFGIASTMILSRILTPEQVGVFSVAAVLTGIAGTVRDFGAGTYVVQEPELTGARLRSAFGLALALGVVLALIAVAASGPAARFYANPGVGDVLLVLALNFLIVPFGSITQAVLMREMRFGAVGVINVSHACVHAGAAILLAVSGFGFMSLAYASVLAALTSALVAAAFRPRTMPWLPSFANMRRVAMFGGQVSASSMLNEVHDGAADLIVGRVSGLEAAGYFGRANSFVTLYSRLVLRALWPVAFSVLAQRHREGGDVGQTLRHFVTLVSGVAWPGLVFLGLYADVVVRVLFGSQWDAAVQPARFLVAAAFFAAPVSLCFLALTAIGDAKLALKLTSAQLAIRVLAVLIGVQHSLESAAAAIAFGSLISAGAISVTAARRLEFKQSQWFAATSSGLVLAVSANVAPGILLLWAPFQRLPLIVQLLGASILAGLSFLLAAIALRHPIWNEIRRVAIELRLRTI